MWGSSLRFAISAAARFRSEMSIDCRSLGLVYTFGCLGSGVAIGHVLFSHERRIHLWKDSASMHPLSSSGSHPLGLLSCPSPSHLPIRFPSSIHTPSYTRPQPVPPPPAAKALASFPSPSREEETPFLSGEVPSPPREKKLPSFRVRSGWG